MAKSKYNSEVSEKICNAIAVYGLDEAGWTAGDISKQTFYVWQKQYPDFSDSVSQAKAEHFKSSRESLKRLANKALLDYLQGNMVKISHTRKQVVGPSGQIVELEEHRTTPVGIPPWAIERVLGVSLSELEAIERLAEIGVIPVWVVDCASKIFVRSREEIAALLRAKLPEPLVYELSRERETTGGLSDATVARIRAEIMGIDAESVAPLPSEVSGG